MYIALILLQSLSNFRILWNKSEMLTIIGILCPNNATLVSQIKRKSPLLILKKNPPSRHISILHVYVFLRFLPPSTPHLMQYTLVESSRIYTGQYTFPILLLNDDNMLGENKGREKNIVYGRLF